MSIEDQGYAPVMRPQIEAEAQCMDAAERVKQTQVRREMFEAWWATYSDEVYSECGGFSGKPVDVAWETWQAAVEAGDAEGWRRLYEWQRDELNTYLAQGQDAANECDIEAIAWAYSKLSAFGLASNTMENALMMDRLNLMLLTAESQA